MHPHTTKNDLYAELIDLGLKKGYVVIPEFRVNVPRTSSAGEATTGRKNIDLVWARRLKVGRQSKPWHDHWELVATFEIEACDVRNTPGKEFNRHISDLPTVRNRNPSARIKHFIALYTAAYDRHWNDKRSFLAEIRERRKWASGTGVKVLDGRSLIPLKHL